jgi:hypothetical protein
VSASSRSVLQGKTPLHSGRARRPVTGTVTTSWSSTIRRFAAHSATMRAGSWRMACLNAFLMLAGGSVSSCSANQAAGCVSSMKTWLSSRPRRFCEAGTPRYALQARRVDRVGPVCRSYPSAFRGCWESSAAGKARPAGSATARAQSTRARSLVWVAWCGGRPMISETDILTDHGDSEGQRRGNGNPGHPLRSGCAERVS